MVKDFSGTEITQESIKVARDNMVDKMKPLGVDALDVFDTPRVCEIQYRGVTLKVASVSIVDEWNANLWALIKTVAAENKMLDGLFCEHQLVGSKMHYPGTTVHDSLLIDCRSARKAATNFLGPSEATPESVKEMFSKKGGFLATVDRHFKVEQLFFAHSTGSEGEARFEEEVLDCLSTSPNEKSAADSVSLLTALGESKLASWVGFGATSQQQTVLQLVKAISCNRSPKFDASANSMFLTRVKERLAHCLVVPPAAFTVAPALTGKEAAEHLYQQVVLKQIAGEPLTLVDLQQLMVFAWLLGHEQRSSLEEMRKRVVSDAPDVLRPVKAPAAKSKVVDKKKCVSSLFKKG